MDWKLEIMACGDLVQDNDAHTTQAEAERRWNRYVELADAVTGTEGSDGVVAIVRSMKAEEDYGAYQAAHMALSRFPSTELGAGIANAVEALHNIPRDWSGNVLFILAHAGSDAVASFNRIIRLKSNEDQIAIRNLIEFHEQEEWLSDEGKHHVLLMPRSGAWSR